MMIIQISGGLGNQLFQYAFGRAISFYNNCDFELDISCFNKTAKNTTPRKYELNNFNIVERIASEESMEQYRKNKIQKFIEELKPYDCRSFIREKKFRANQKKFKPPVNVYLQGYWQSEEHFRDIEDVIRQEVTLKIPIQNKYLSLIDNSDTISIHVRRGDYVTDKIINETHGLCALDYYHQAIDLMAARVKFPTFFIFSDDIDWVKNNLKINYPTVYVSNNETSSCEELILMSQCQHNVIANSSFSWWGAWLNKNPHKVIITPAKWFNNNNKNINDLIPAAWTKL